jgi:hypothetical protein
VNPTLSLRCLTLGCCGLLLALVTGCSRWFELTNRPDNGDDRAAHVIARDEQVPLILDRVRTTRNGSPQNSSSETEQRVLSSLADIGLFSHLASTNTTSEDSDIKTVHARLLYDEAIDPHAGGAALKGILIGASMYILAPFIALEYDYAAHLTLELERWDGQVKRYESQSAGTARYHLFGATPIMLDELKGHVTETCLIDLARQIVNDTTFFAASSAPMAEPGIRTVSVKSRVPRKTASVSPAIPVTAPAPVEP